MVAYPGKKGVKMAEIRGFAGNFPPSGRVGGAVTSQTRMKGIIMKIETLQEAFVMELSDIYNAEKQLTKALPKMAKAASDAQLVQGFETHLKETEEQIERIDRLVELCDLKLKREKCDAMEGLIAEGDEVVDMTEEGPVRDAMLITAAQKVEHYEMAGYGSLVELAKKLGLPAQAVQLLQDTLEEEKATDAKLNKLALQGINEKAMRQAA
jgi:ferritin-like metal-binding protein YciE